VRGWLPGSDAPASAVGRVGAEQVGSRRISGGGRPAVVVPDEQRWSPSWGLAAHHRWPRSIPIWGERLARTHGDLGGVEDAGAAAPDCYRWSHRQGVSGVCICRSMRSCCRCDHREDLGRRPRGDGLFCAACSGDLCAVWCH
jgi:hypothetical protein